MILAVAQKRGKLIGSEVGHCEIFRPHPLGKGIQRLSHRQLIGTGEPALGRKVPDECVAAGFHKTSESSLCYFSE